MEGQREREGEREGDRSGRGGWNRISSWQSQFVSVTLDSVWNCVCVVSCN